MAGAGSYRADKRRMRYFVVVALIVLGVIFLRQKKAENSVAPKNGGSRGSGNIDAAPGQRARLGKGCN